MALTYCIYYYKTCICVWCLCQWTAVLFACQKQFSISACFFLLNFYFKLVSSSKFHRWRHAVMLYLFSSFYIRLKQHWRSMGSFSFVDLVTPLMWCTVVYAWGECKSLIFLTEIWFKLRFNLSLRFKSLILSIEIWLNVEISTKMFYFIFL